MPHLDGPLFYPTITTISCGSHTILEFLEPTGDENPEYLQTLDNKIGSTNIDTSTSNNLRKLFCKVLLERRSLLVLKDDMYHKYLHSIAEIDEDFIGEDIVNLEQCCDDYTLGERLKREKRISLTIRHVPKTSKMKLKLGN